MVPLIFDNKYVLVPYTPLPDDFAPSHAAYASSGGVN